MTISVLGIDLGLSGARAAVLDDTGRLLGRGRVAHRARSQIDDCIERDPAGWMDDAIAAARLALTEADSPGIAAIGIGALGPCPVLLDDDLRPLGPAPRAVVYRVPFYPVLPSANPPSSLRFSVTPVWVILFRR